MAKVGDYEPEIKSKIVSKGKTVIQIEISEEERYKLWVEMQEMLEIYKQKRKNAERSFVTQFPTHWALYKAIRSKNYPNQE